MDILFILEILVPTKRITTCSHIYLFTFGNERRKSVGEMPSHNHEATTQITGNHTHKIIADQVSSVGNAVSIACNQGISQYTQKGITTLDGNHNHIVSVNNTGNNEAHNNLQPYLAVYMWKRIA